jgi:4-hydroxy-tetrahydrodipicolinate reductase
MKVAIIGYGKMGKPIESVLEEQGEEVVLRIDHNNLDEFTCENLSKADVAIEFSRPESGFENITKCLKCGIPVVSGTTGWLDRRAEVEELSEESGVAFFYAPNFSIGVNIFFALNKWLAERMVNFDQYRPSMEEIHHLEKLDAPSGTAIKLAEDLIEALPLLQSWVNEKTDSSEVLEILSKREADVKGTHSISYASDVDCISIKHEAFSRKGFAEGAVAAARFIIGKNGVFGMKDLLQL